MEIGALESRNTADDKSSKSPTEQGREIGISTIRTGMNGEYVAVVYSREAQQFIIDNIEAVISNANSKKKPLMLKIKDINGSRSMKNA